MLPKSERFRIFVERLNVAKRAASFSEAFYLLSTILNAVEDEFSGIGADPSNWLSDGRMYPPQEDSRRDVPDHPSLKRYRTVRHNAYIGANGAIRIETLDGELVLDKPGADGKRASELDEDEDQGLTVL